MTEPLYYIIEHPTRGVLKDLEETAAGKVGRFSWSGMRTEAMRFRSVKEAVKTLDRIDRSDGCQIRKSFYDRKHYMGSWPVVWPKP